MREIGSSAHGRREFSLQHGVRERRRVCEMGAGRTRGAGRRGRLMGWPAEWMSIHGQEHCPSHSRAGGTCRHNGRNATTKCLQAEAICSRQSIPGLGLLLFNGHLSRSTLSCSLCPSPCAVSCSPRRCFLTTTLHLT